ncbi:DUF1127 domain-containing protein [Yoonia sediminilitoris]|uniref:DUF1127 domain-containing protein n=1 Tax=Yoonia sediminilitoris TaxID=1286148 RepID=A0A2T6KPY3_9RHOB|nr:DUF1127 domain-containing protein [Yoonia sediminilitoris]PUB18598.1 hypothetical protein C8N45_101182 [Yoonia sediminilitoris]RCW98766.1 hypothetical protein DFP92_101182 [Yoonia sediminilitoris]
MAFQSDNSLISNSEVLAELGHMLLAPVRAIGNGLVYLAENNPRVQALNAVSAMTDAELAEKGMTREEALRNAVPHLM